MFRSRLIPWSLARLALVWTCGAVAGVRPLTAAEAFAHQPFIEKYCAGCHDRATKAGALDLTALNYPPDNVDNFARWVKVHDRLKAGEMPPKDEERPPAGELSSVV